MLFVLLILNCSQLHKDIKKNSLQELDHLYYAKDSCNLKAMISSNRDNISFLAHIINYNDIELFEYATEGLQINKLYKREDLTEYVLDELPYRRNSEDKFTLVMYAAWKGKKDIVDFLITRGADLLFEYNNVSALTESIAGITDQGGESTIDFAKYMIKKAFSDKNSKSSSGLYWAILADSIELLVLLLDKGANINVSYYNPLVYALRNNKIDIIRFLIRNNASFDVRNEVIFDEFTPMEVANTEAKKIIRYELGINTINNFFSCYDVKKLESLLNKGLDINYKSESNITALMHKCSNMIKDELETVMFLLLRGADPNVIGKDGKTAIDCSIKRITNSELVLEKTRSPGIEFFKWKTKQLIDSRNKFIKLIEIFTYSPIYNYNDSESVFEEFNNHKYSDEINVLSSYVNSMNLFYKSFWNSNDTILAGRFVVKNNLLSFKPKIKNVNFIFEDAKEKYIESMISLFIAIRDNVKEEDKKLFFHLLAHLPMDLIKDIISYII